jgi:hypothetical protein
MVRRAPAVFFGACAGRRNGAVNEKEVAAFILHTCIAAGA